MSSLFSVSVIGLLQAFIARLLNTSKLKKKYLYRCLHISRFLLGLKMSFILTVPVFLFVSRCFCNPTEFFEIWPAIVLNHWC